MEKANQNYFVYEITESDKIKNLNDLSKVCGAVNYFPCKASTGKCARKDKYYDAIVKVLKKFIRERKGIYKWEVGEVTSFRQICCNLPKRYRYILKNLLERETKKYMISRLDEMVRFSFYLKDKQQWDICNGMINILSECGI